MAYQIGRLEQIQDDDPIFETQDEAEDAVMELAIFDAGTFGLWEVDEGNAELLAIAYDNEIFYK